jgi:putative transcriptional regulator
MTGHLLVASPAMPDPRFEKTVIYICNHSADGAMGLVINRPFEGVSFAELMKQLEVTGPLMPIDQPVLYGGPVESERGFVLHSSDYDSEATLDIELGVSLTASFEILRAISIGEGPKDQLLLLGYAGWGAGQLDAELRDNGWLMVPGNIELIFNTPLDDKWERALASLGIDPRMMTGDIGHA